MAEAGTGVVIVGGGTAGCIVATRLSEDPDRSVLLLEAGPDFRDLDDCPPSVVTEMGYPFELMWEYDGIATERDDHHVVAYRGRVLGGSGSVNGMLYARGAPEDYDGWGSPLWTDAALRPTFARIERDLDLGGNGGSVPIRRAPRAEWPVAQAAFVDAAVECGHEARDDLLPNTLDGVGPIPRNCKDGVRMSMAHCYLNPVRDRPNLTVRGDSTVSRVLVENGRAVGVETLGPEGPTTIAANDVILAAGGIGSPHILTLSGIGPGEVLRRLQVPVVHELPGVGRNLTDHAIVQVIATLAEGVAFDDPRPLTVLRHTSPGSPWPGDLYTMALTGDFSAAVDRSPGGQGHVCLMCVLHLPESVGEVEVVSSNPAELPSVRFRYLDTDRDRERFRYLARHADRLLRTGPLGALVDEVIAPAPAVLDDDHALDEWIRGTLGTLLHGAGTCRMGPAEDPDAVVDERGRVHGVEGLRVMDFSVAPTVVRAPTNATAMAIGERMAELFLQETADRDARPAPSDP
jgi:choline dehydrogenase